VNLSGISVVVTSDGHAATVARCLESVRGFGEVLVIDAFSTDGTPAIARRYPATVYSHPARAVAERRRWGASRAANRWVLYLDADEEVTPELRRTIEAAGDPPGGGYRLRVRYEYLGRRMRGAAYPRRTGARLAARSDAGGGGRGTAILDGAVLRHGFADVHAHLEHINARMPGGAAGGGRLPAVAGMLAAPPLVFLYGYCARFGAIDGARGFLYCLLSAYAAFIQYAKKREGAGARTAVGRAAAL
jgi:glycosyltransferase involved in cell wall biosynthesis